MSRKYLNSALLFVFALSWVWLTPQTAEAAPGRSYRFIFSEDDYFARYHIYSVRRFDDLLLRSFENDPYYNSSGSFVPGLDDLWGVKKIKANNVWGTYQGSGIVIAIVDSGITRNHEDIFSNYWINQLELNGRKNNDDDGNGVKDDIYGWDFVDNDNNPADLNGHGTHVAGIAAAIRNNLKGIIGVAPLAKVMAVRVLNRLGNGALGAIADGIRYAAMTGARIINLSLGVDLSLVIPALTPEEKTAARDLLQSAVNFAVGKNSIVVVSAGNDNTNIDSDILLASLSNVIAVGATNSTDTRASFSNFGSSLWITAPGVDILSLGTRRVHIGSQISGTSNYYVASGTSMAAPFVSGAIALLLEKNPLLTLSDIQDVLKRGAVHSSAPDSSCAGVPSGTSCFDDDYGYGILDIEASLALVVGGGGGGASISGSSSGSSGSTSGASATQTTVVQNVVNKVTDFVSATFFGDSASKYEVTQEDIQRAYASIGFSRQNTYQEKQDQFQDFHS